MVSTLFTFSNGFSFNFLGTFSQWPGVVPGVTLGPQGSGGRPNGLNGVWGGALYSGVPGRRDPGHGGRGCFPHGPHCGIVVCGPSCANRPPWGINHEGFIVGGVAGKRPRGMLVFLANTNWFFFITGRIFCWCHTKVVAFLFVPPFIRSAVYMDYLVLGGVNHIFWARTFCVTRKYI